jgi:hypothetical protein
MDKIKVKVTKGSRNGPVETFVDGYTADDIPGLGIHKSDCGRDWMITHLESGMDTVPSFVVLKRRKDAYAVAREIAKCGDWKRDRREILSDTEFVRAFQEVFRRDEFRYLCATVW